MIIMSISLSEREWREFCVEDIFNVFNLKPYHKHQLNLSSELNAIPYVTRTNKNNGVEDFVEYISDMESNPANIVVFGAENATFFYQPFNNISGNKMYGISNEKFNKNIGLFVTQMLNSSVEKCGFGYGQGLTGTRERRRKVMLPVQQDNEKIPDWLFMDRYISEQEKINKNKYITYIQRKIELYSFKEVERLSEKSWEEFYIKDLFSEIKRGKRLIKANQIPGNIPYISSTADNNGIDNFISNDKNVRKFKNCLSIANSGSVGASFYEPFEFIASDHITHLKNNSMNKFTYLFIATITSRLKDKYNFNREISDTRIAKEKIILPISKKGQPDYQYMEQYMKNIIITKYKDYLQYNNVLTF